MAGLSRYETLILGAAAAFLLFAGGWFLGSRNLAQPYEVTTLGRGESSSAAESEPEDKSWPDSLLEGERIDLNRADVYDLARLPGIGEKRAQAIVKYREAKGPFRSVEELNQIPGIGEGIIGGLRQYVLVENMEG